MTIKNFSPYDIIQAAVAELKENERRVITGRFGVKSRRKTLSLIGKELKLSRERVRQIERETLKKLAVKILDQNREATERIIKLFEKSGGLTVNHKIADRFLEDAYRGDVNQFNSLNLIFFIIPQLKKIKKTRELEEGWVLARISKDDAVGVINEWVSHLEKTKEPQTLEVLLNAHPHHARYEVTFLSELPSISKKIIKTDEGQIGLSSWAEVNPRNIRDKIYYILKRYGKPMHFREIARKIKEQNFDQKNVVKATVHNELIADERFILVGRGIYALRQWGYRSGTVLEILKGVLAAKKEGMELDELISEVLEQRIVRRNTILINLKTRKEFKKIGERRYALA